MTTSEIVVYVLLLGAPGFLLVSLALALVTSGLAGLTGILGFLVWIVQSARGRHRALRGARS